jgi:hypothetical protein
MRNRDMIRAIDSRSDLDRRIIRQVANDWNFDNLESTEHGVETCKMQDRDKTWIVRSMEISTVNQTR